MARRRDIAPRSLPIAVGDDSAARAGIPDPNASATFEASRLDWSDIGQARHHEWLRSYRQLLKLRCQHIAHRLSPGCRFKADYEIHGDRGVTARWKFGDGSKLILLANLGAEPLSGLTVPTAQIIYATDELSTDALKRGALPAWSLAWFLEP